MGFEWGPTGKYLEKGYSKCPDIRQPFIVPLARGSLCKARAVIHEFTPQVVNSFQITHWWIQVLWCPPTNLAPKRHLPGTSLVGSYSQPRDSGRATTVRIAQVPALSKPKVDEYRHICMRQQNVGRFDVIVSCQVK